MGKKRHSNAHLRSFRFSSVCIMGFPKLTCWNHNEWPFVKALADALVTFKLKTVSFFSSKNENDSVSFSVIDLKWGLSSFIRMN